MCARMETRTVMVQNGARSAKKQKREELRCEKLRNHVKTLEKELEPIDDEGDFFRLYDALLMHNSKFCGLRCQLLAAWKRGGQLFTLKIKDTQELSEDHELRVDLAIFAWQGGPRPAWLTLPVFCWRDTGGACVVLWTAPHMRKLGLAKELLARLGIARAYNVLPESRPFWAHLAIPEVDKLPQSGEPL